MLIRALSADDDLSTFHSGDAALDAWLVVHARRNQERGFAVTYLAFEGPEIVAYLAVAATNVDRARVKRGQGPPQWPALLVARMAVAQARQGQGLGRQLLLHAFAVAVEQQRLSGCAAIAVDAKPGADAFYRRYGFANEVPLPGDRSRTPADRTRLLLQIEEARRIIGGGGTP